VNLWGKTDEIRLTVKDFGKGFDPAQALNARGLGLMSMRERLRLVNGELLIQSQIKHGTTVQAVVHLEQPS
ncbi:MAG: ATP-binding protein, partial [Candidatus Korobacteraceae bacterium]